MSRSTTGSHGKNWIDRKSKTRGTDWRPSRRPSTITERRAQLGFQWRLFLLLSGKRIRPGRLVFRIQRRFLLDGHHTVSHPSPRLSSNMKQLEMLRLRDSGPIAARKIIWLVTFVCALRRRSWPLLILRDSLTCFFPLRNDHLLLVLPATRRLGKLRGVTAVAASCARQIKIGTEFKGIGWGRRRFLNSFILSFSYSSRFFDYSRHNLVAADEMGYKPQGLCQHNTK